MQFNQKSLVLISGLLFVPPTFATPISNYYEDWEGGDVAGWTQNTTSTELSYSAAGGNPGGYLVSSRKANDINGFPIGAAYRESELTGDFSANSWDISFDVSYMRGSFTDSWLRFRYHDATYNGWLLDIEDTFNSDWTSYNVYIDPTWSDAEAMANGWMQEDPSITWAMTMSDVYYTEIRIAGANAMQAGIDNFRMTAANIPEPATLALMLVGVGIIGYRRQRSNETHSSFV